MINTVDKTLYHVCSKKRYRRYLLNILCLWFLCIMLIDEPWTFRNKEMWHDCQWDIYPPWRWKNDFDKSTYRLLYVLQKSERKKFPKVSYIRSQHKKFYRARAVQPVNVVNEKTNSLINSWALKIPIAHGQSFMLTMSRKTDFDPGF